jgi:hypothetical protein
MANLNRLYFITSTLLFAVTSCKTAEPTYFSKVDRTKPTTCLRFPELHLSKKQLFYMKKNVRAHLDGDVPFSDDNLCLRMAGLSPQTKIVKVTLPLGNHIGPLWFLAKNDQISLLLINFKELKNDSTSIKQRISDVLKPISNITADDIKGVDKYFITQSDMWK